MAAKLVQVVTVFGSARTEPGTPAYETAEAMGRALAEAGFTVASGGYAGTMGAVSKGANEAGGHVIGVTTDQFDAQPNEWILEEIRVPDWTERLFKLVELGQGYVAMPGGTGTLVELSVVWEWNNKKFFHVDGAQRPVVLLGDYWEAVINAVAEKEIWNQSPLLRCATPVEAAEELKVALRGSA